MAWQRNTALCSLAGMMRRRGLSERAIRAALEVVNDERCRPPLSASEVAGIAASVARYAPAPHRDRGEGLTDPEPIKTKPREPHPAPAINRQTGEIDGDPLLLIPAPLYVERLLNVHVPPDGKVCCPFHEDTVPSMQLYDGTQGWYCFGACRTGGTIIDFGARLWGITPRGAGYHEVRRRLAAELGFGAVVA